MKILWIAHEGGLSGANICMLEYISILQQEGFVQELIIPQDAALAKSALSKNIAVHIIPFYSWASPLHPSPVSFLVRLRKWLRNKKAIIQAISLIKKISPDYVTTNTISTPVGAWAAHKCNANHIWFIHEFGEEDHGFTIAGNFSKGAALINRLSQKVVFNSLAVQKKFEPFVSNRKRYLVYNAVNTTPGSSYTKSNSEKLRLIILGQVAPSKNHIEALQALKICKDRGLDFELDIVGKAEDPSYLDELKNYITSAGLNVNLKGFSSKPVELLQQQDALLMCSRMEAFGRVTVEALKCGIPVVAAASGGSLEIVEDGTTGYFYQPGDVEDFAEKIILLKKNYFQFNKENIAREAYQRFSEENTRKQLLKVFD